MSRLGKRPIQIPAGVEVSVTDSSVSAKGSKGELSTEILYGVSVKKEENSVITSIDNDNNKAAWGTTWSNIRNIILGVSEGFEKKLEINGVGYRGKMQGKKLVLNLGFSHQVEFEAPEGVEVKIEKNIITVSGADKQKVGQAAAVIREFKKPEPYKGKGIKYIDEHIRRKEGKKAASAE